MAGIGIIGLLGVAAAALATPSVRAQVVDDWTSTSSALWGTAANWSAGLPNSAEPATYGAILVGISLFGVVVYRRKRSAA